MSKLIYDRISNVKKESSNFEKDTIPAMPKLKLSGTSVNSKTQLGESGNDPDKENRNVANIMEKKDKNRKSDIGSKTIKESATFPSNQENNGYESYKEKSRLSNDLRNQCASPHFNGGWTNPSSSRNLQAEIRREILQERFTLENEGILKKENSKDRYSKPQFDGLPSNQTLMEKTLEGGNVRRSMSLEDLRQGRKAFEMEQKLGLYSQEEPRDYTFSFNTRKHSMASKVPQQHGNVFHEGTAGKRNFETNLDAYINYFDKEQELMGTKNSKRGENVDGHHQHHQHHQHQHVDNNNCKVHLKQLKGAYAEIGYLREQVERLKHKKNELISVNTQLLREVNYNQIKEKSIKQKSQLMHAQVICLRQEVRHYKNKLREAQMMVEEERISNENHLIFLKDILSNNISLALEHKLKHHLSSEKEREHKHRNSIRHYIGDGYGHNTRPRRPSPQEYLYSFDEKIEMPDPGRYGSMRKRKADPNMMLKGGLSPWVSLHNISPELAEENEITEQSDQNGLVEKEQWNEEEEGEQEEYDQGDAIEELEEEKYEENEENNEEGNQEIENEEEVEEVEEVEKVHSGQKNSSKKDKQIKWLQKKLSELLKGDKTSSVVHSHSKDRGHKYSKFRPIATEKIGYHHGKSNYMRYDEADRRQSNTFGGVMKHDDINNYSFSLHNSEE